MTGSIPPVRPVARGPEPCQCRPHGIPRFGTLQGVFCRMLNRTILNDDEPEKSDGKDKDKDKEKFPVIGERLFKARTILIYGGIDQKLAARISAQLLALQAAGDAPSTLFLNTQGRHESRRASCRE